MSYRISHIIGTLLLTAPTQPKDDTLGVEACVHAFKILDLGSS
uniref:Uncharacterized protein n=1 Tax=Rhizophora mucronata TaxID=61149 RepID=A0A2P2Q6K7_RHIMU